MRKPETKLIEPFKSAQTYIVWPDYLGHADGEKVWYKYVKTGGFFSFKLLYVWGKKKEWGVSAHCKPPKHLAKQSKVFKIKNKHRLKLQNLEIQNDQTPEDIAWEQEQQEFIKQAALRRAKMAESDRERQKILDNNKTDKLLDAYLKKNRKRSRY